MFVENDTGSISDRLSVNDRSGTQTNSSRIDSLCISKANKKTLPQNKGFMSYNSQNYLSVPSKPSYQSKALRAWLTTLIATKIERFFTTWYLWFLKLYYLFESEFVKNKKVSEDF